MNEKILIVDREPDIRKALENLMRKNGYQVTSIARGDMVLDLFRSESFDLVIMDINLQDINGFQLIREMKTLDENIKIIILTGQISIENVKQALRRNGAFDFLSKPLEDESQLIISVKQALEKNSVSKESLSASIAMENKQPAVKKVLIVDDDLHFCRMIEKILSRYNYQTDSAFDGFSAGTKVAEFKPDLILLDLVMPGMNGLEVCKQIKMNPNTSHIKIVAITGYDSEENRTKFLLAGADGYLAKPISQASLIDLIKKIEVCENVG